MLQKYFDILKKKCYYKRVVWIVEGRVMIEKSNVNEVKKNIEDHVGQKVLLRGSLGRNKSFEKEGTLINAYPNMFLVQTDNGMEKLSYRYVDVLTKTVEFNVNQNGNFNSILNVIDNQHQSLNL
jgi:uncharacterized protein Veg